MKNKMVIPVRSLDRLFSRQYKQEEIKSQYLFSLNPRGCDHQHCDIFVAQQLLNTSQWLHLSEQQPMSVCYYLIMS